jgi:hypothetical protein
MPRSPVLSTASTWTRRANLARRFPDDPAAARRWFRGLLWHAFPEAQTDLDLARRAAVVLEVSEGRVRGWLRCDHDAKLLEVLKVLAIAGAEVVLREGGQ